MAWDRSTGAPQGPAIVWQDRRAEVVCERLREHGAFLAEHTGLELDPYFVAPKIVWLREQLGDEPNITTTDAWMLHRLCGAFVTDVATAGRSLLLDLDTGRVERRAPARSSASIRRRCRPWSATPRRSATARCSAARSPSAERASTSRPRCSPSTATQRARPSAPTAPARSCWRALATKPTRSTNGLVGCPAWRIGDDLTYCLDGQVYTVGAAVSWLIDVGDHVGARRSRPPRCDRRRRRAASRSFRRSPDWPRRTGSRRPRRRSPG